MINSAIFNQLKEYIIPKIDSKLANISIGNHTKRIPMFEVNFTNTFIRIKPLKSENVMITFQNLSTKTDIYANGIDGNISMDIDYEFTKIKDHIHCDALLRSMYIDSIITHEVTKDGSPSVQAKATLHMEPVKAELIFSGGISAKILELLEPIIKIFLVEATDMGVNRYLYKWIEEEMNFLLSSFITEYKITETISLNYELTSSSSYFDNALIIPISGYFYYKDSKFPPSQIPNPLPNFNTSLHKNAQFYISEYMINSVLNISFIHNIFSIAFEYNSLTPFDMNLSCNVTKSPPLFEFMNSKMTTNISFFCNVSALNRTEEKITLFNVYGSLAGNLDYFLTSGLDAIRLYINSLTGIELAFIKPDEFNVDWFTNGSKDIASYVFQLINLNYLSHEIPFPHINHFSILNIVVLDNLLYLGIYSDLSII